MKNQIVSNKIYADVFISHLKSNHPGEVVINDEGWGEFYVSPGSVSVWIEK